MDAPLVCYDCLTVVATDWQNCPGCGTVCPRGGWGLDPLVGLVLNDRYKIVSRLGEGGMGTVYKAHRTGSLGGEVAVKVLSPQLSRTVIARRFEREARVVSELSSPHIVRIYDFETFVYPVDGAALFYIAMELVKGAPLSGLMQALGGPVNFMWGIEVLRQVARGLDEAHNRGIVHRDLKPGNVMVIRERLSTHVKILDFGIAAITDDGALEAEKLTRTGMVTGTPDYMAPEQAMGVDIGPAADMYSLGVMAFHMFSGKLPFSGPTAMAVLTQRVTTDAPPLIEVMGDTAIPEPVRAIVDRLLAREPHDRYQNAGELLDDLAQFPVIQSAPDIVPDEAAVARFTQHATGSDKLPIQLKKTIASAPKATSKVEPSGKKNGLWLWASLALLIAGGVGLAIGVQDTADQTRSKARVTTTAPQDAAASPAETAVSPDGGPDVTEPAPPTPLKKPAPKRLVLDRPRPAWPKGYEIAWTGKLKDGGTVSVAMTSPRPAIHLPINSLWQVDRGGQGLILNRIAGHVSLSGNTVGTPNNVSVRDDGRIALDLPPLPMVSSYLLKVEVTLAEGTTATLSFTYDAASGRLSPR